VDHQLVFFMLFPLDTSGEAARMSITDRALFEDRGWAREPSVE
jgi:hypothetical protein